MAGTSNPSESKSVNAIAQRVAVDSRDEIHPRHLFDKHLDRLRQSVVFAAAVVRQQPVGYFLADNGAANVKEAMELRADCSGLDCVFVLLPI